MKMKLSCMLIIGFLLFSEFGYSQEKRFVEVTVSDTVSLKVTQIVYEINLGNQVEFMGMSIPSDGDNSQNAPTTSMQEIKIMLDKEKFMYMVSPENEYKISSSKTEPGILVTLNSEKELKKLCALFKPQAGISGKVKSVSYEPVSNYSAMLYKRLWTKATTEAGQMTTATGNTVGPLISISESKEVQNSYDNYMDMYKDLLKGMTAGMYGENAADKKVVEIQKTFKFELK
jgi:hypothetical protein